MTLINKTIINYSDNSQATNPITYLTNQGLNLTLINNQLKLTPSYLMTKDIVQYVNAHKEMIKQQLLEAKEYAELINQLNQSQQRWLADLVDYLGISAEYAMQKHIVTKQDIVEYSHHNPKQVADCLRKGGSLLHNI